MAALARAPARAGRRGGRLSADPRARSDARALIVGAGDLGTRAAAALTGLGYTATALSRSGHASLPSLRADLLAPHTLAPLEGLAFDLALFCAAPGGLGDRSTPRPEAYQALYRDGTLAVLRRASIERVLFVSSTAVYGDRAGDWVDERTPPEPAAWNGVALLDAEQALRQHRPDAIVLRCAGLYGPGRTGLLDRLRRGGAIGRAYSNRIRVEDAAAAITCVAARGQAGALYDLADGAPERLHVIACACARRLGLPDPPLAEVDGPDRRVRAQAIRKLGFEPRWPDWQAGFADLG